MVVVLLFEFVYCFNLSLSLSHALCLSSLLGERRALTRIFSMQYIYTYTYSSWELYKGFRVSVLQLSMGLHVYIYI